MLRLVPNPPGRIVDGSIKIDGRDIVALSDSEMRQIRGNDISMIFPGADDLVEPVMTIGAQISETIRLHQDLSKSAALDKAVEMLRLVKSGTGAARQGISAPALGRHAAAGDDRDGIVVQPPRADRRRADDRARREIQAQILDLILDLQNKFGTAVLLITHDLGVVAETAHRVIVMYAGKKVEEADVEDLFESPLHPYTHGLLG